MTKDELIAIAKQSGMYVNDMDEYCICDFGYEWQDGIPLAAMMKFAKIIAAKEREACAVIVSVDGPHLYAHGYDCCFGTLEDVAKAIRARGVYD